MKHCISKTPPKLIALILLSMASSATHAATIQWAGKHPDSKSWEEPSNWSTNRTPLSGIDSVTFYPDAATLANKPNHRTQPMLHETFVIGAGQQMVSADKSNGVLRIDDGGHLVIARGGTLDFSTNGEFNLAEGGGDMRLTVEAGASVKVSGFYNGSNTNHTIRFIADQHGVSPIEVKYSAHINGGRVEVDLESYDLRNGSDLILITQLRTAPQTTTFKEVVISGGWSGTMDYNYLTSDGRAAIALTNLHKTGEPVGIPEPSAYGLILSTITLAMALTRRRRPQKQL